jgi:hypothetical protein
VYDELKNLFAQDKQIIQEKAFNNNNSNNNSSNGNKRRKLNDIMDM